MNALVQRATIYEIEAARNRSIQLYGDAYDLMLDAAKATPPGVMELPVIGWSGHGYISRPDREDYLAKVTKNIDTGVWNHLILATGLDTLMDRTERDAFREECRKDPPPATADNCLATIERLMGDRELIFKRGIAKTFSRLDRRFRSHDGFKIGARIVLSRMLGVDGWWNHYARHDETLLDVERAFALLDGKPQPERDGGIVGAIKLAKDGMFGAQAFTATSDYFRVNVFMNGNAHVWFERKDLVEKVNELLAEYYGAALGAAPDVAAKNHAPATTMAKNMGFFETPTAVAWRLFESAMVRVTEERGGASTPLTILEPSAGLGALAKPMLHSGHHVVCIEAHSGRAEQLRALTGFKRIIPGDFLEETPDGLGKFDAVVMNPPFDGQRDIDHVVHAAAFLKPGGWLAAVMSAGVEFNSNAKAVDFRAMVKARGGRFYDLPPGSFAESGTMVNTVIVTMRGV